MGSDFTKEEMEDIVKSSYMISECLRKMGRPCGGGNYRVFHYYVKKYNLDISHFDRFKHLRGPKPEKTKDSSHYSKNTVHIKSDKLIKKLIDEGIKEYKCENPECGISSWHGKEIKLQLHHIDGNHFNNEVDNLMILCPNCHSQTDNFCGRKIKNTSKEFCYCCVCGKKIGKKTKTGKCPDCAKKVQRRVERPSKETLEKKLFEYNFLKVAKMYGVTDNAIRKWCKHYGLSTKSKDYKQIND